jgi:hypothetical protein
MEQVFNESSGYENRHVLDRIDTGIKLWEKKYRDLCEGVVRNPDKLPKLDDYQKGTLGFLLDIYSRFQKLESVRVHNIGNFDKFAYPLIRLVYPSLITNEIVTVQPMAGPTSLVFYLDFVFGTNKGQILGGQTAFDAIAGPLDTRTYSSEDVIGETYSFTGASTLTINLAFTPVRPGTVKIDTGTLENTTATDDGAQTISGNIGGINISSGSINYATGQISLTLASAFTGTILVSYVFDSEANDKIPEYELQITSSVVTARTRKLKVRWSLEAAQQANALHGIDLENELVGAIAQQIKFEIDRETINNLFNIAAAGTTTWSKTVPAGISWTEHKLSLVDAFIDASNLIYLATKRAQANFIIASTGVATIIESLPTFIPNPGALQTQGTTGVVKIGVLQNRWVVYKDPFLGQNLPSGQRDIAIVGYKGASWNDAGYLYSPYILPYLTPTVVLDDFVGRKGIATQYGTKVINPRFYARVQVVA